MKLTNENIGHYVKIKNSLLKENDGVWLKIQRVGSNFIDVWNPIADKTYMIMDYENRVTDLCEVIPKKKLEFKDIRVGMWIKIDSKLYFSSQNLRKLVGTWIKVTHQGNKTNSPCAEGYYWDEREIEDISETNPTLPRPTIIKEENKENNMVSENELKELGDIEGENLVKAKELADKELATKQQERASQIYKEILNELEEVKLSIKKSTERKTVLEEALKKYSK